MDPEGKKEMYGGLGKSEVNKPIKRDHILNATKDFIFLHPFNTYYKQESPW